MSISYTSRTVPIYEEKWGLPTSPTTFRDEQMHSSTAPGRLQATAILGQNIVHRICCDGRCIRAALRGELEVDDVVLR